MWPQQTETNWTGNVPHQPEERPASTGMNWVLEGSKWCQGRSSRMWRTTLEEDLKSVKLAGGVASDDPRRLMPQQGWEEQSGSSGR